LGRRRRRVIRIVKKKLPTVFVCPRCGEEAVRVSIAKDTGRATVLCALCSLKDEFQAHPAAQMIDVYSYFADRFYGVKDPRPIIPREREAPHRLVEETEAPAEPTTPLQTAIVQSEQEPIVKVERPEESPVPSIYPEAAAVPEEPAAVAAEQPEQPSTEAATDQAEEAPQGPEEDNEPFADILQNKDKKRYSSNPLPEQSSE
jgi:transcription elongation factor Elf1